MYFMWRELNFEILFTRTADSKFGGKYFLRSSDLQRRAFRSKESFLF